MSRQKAVISAVVSLRVVPSSSSRDAWASREKRQEPEILRRNALESELVPDEFRTTACLRKEVIRPREHVPDDRREATSVRSVRHQPHLIWHEEA